MYKKLTCALALILAVCVALSGCSMIEDAKTIIEDVVREAAETVKDELEPEDGTGVKSLIESKNTSKKGERATAAASKTTGERRTIPFSQIEYERPDTQEILGLMDTAIESAKNGGAQEQIDAYDKLETAYESFNTMVTVAMIRNSIDGSDEFYKTEYEWGMQADVELGDKMEEVYSAYSESKYEAELAEKFGEDFFDDMAEASIYKYDGAAELKKRENELVADYTELMINPTIVFEGKERGIEEVLSDESLDYDQYVKALELYNDKYNAAAGEIYVELVKTRLKLAELTGYASYEEMMYENYDRDYTPEQAEEYKNAIKEYLVPIDSYIMNMGYSYGGSAAVDADEAMRTFKTTLADISPELLSAFEFMEENELIDYAPSENKKSGSYEVYIYDYDAPFIVTGFDDTAYGLFGVIHEFGHFNDDYAHFDIMETQSETLDMAEVYSQGLEYIMMFCMEDFFGDEANSVVNYRLADSLSTFVTQSYYNELESKIYKLDESEVTLEKINAIAGETSKEYGFDDSHLGGNYYSRAWTDISHIFEMPFYTISYVTSNDAAMQIMQKCMEDYYGGTEVYTELVKRTGDDTFLDDLERVGLESPFKEGRIEELADFYTELFGVSDDTAEYDYSMAA